MFYLQSKREHTERRSSNAGLQLTLGFYLIVDNEMQAQLQGKKHAHTTISHYIAAKLPGT